jgi:hypothetical protein
MKFLISDTIHGMSGLSVFCFLVIQLSSYKYAVVTSVQDCFSAVSLQGMSLLGTQGQLLDMFCIYALLLLTDEGRISKFSLWVGG